MKHSVTVFGLALVWAFAAGSLGATAADKIIKSSNGSCQLSVPADWILGGLPGMADSPDKKMHAIVSSPKMVDSFAELKQTARGIYKNSKVTKDAATEFEMEGMSVSSKPDVYRAIPAGGSVYCIAEVMFPGGPADEARRIVETLKAVK